MPYLTLNGIDVPVAADSSPTLSIKRQGSASRSYGGQHRLGYGARRREWKLRTVPLPQPEAEALRALIDGKALAWQFEGSPNSDSGLAPTPSSTTPSYSSTAGARPGSLALYAGVSGYTGRVTFNLPRSTDWTLLDHAYLPSPAWHSRVIRSDGARWLRPAGGGSALVRDDAMDVWHQQYDAATGQLTLSSPTYGGAAWAAGQARALGSTYTSGNSAYRVTVAGTTGTVAPAWSSTHGATITDGTVTWRNVGFFSTHHAMLAWLPFKVPDTWVGPLTLWLNSNNTFASPWLLATGTFTPEPWLRLVGESGEGELSEFVQNGSRVVGEAFDFVLREV